MKIKILPAVVFLFVISSCKFSSSTLSSSASSEDFSAAELVSEVQNMGSSEWNDYISSQDAGTSQTLQKCKDCLAPNSFAQGVGTQITASANGLYGLFVDGFIGDVSFIVKTVPTAAAKCFYKAPAALWKGAMVLTKGVYNYGSMVCEYYSGSGGGGGTMAIESSMVSAAEKIVDLSKVTSKIARAGYQNAEAIAKFLYRLYEDENYFNEVVRASYGSATVLQGLIGMAVAAGASSFNSMSCSNLFDLVYRTLPRIGGAVTYEFLVIAGVSFVTLGGASAVKCAQLVAKLQRFGELDEQYARFYQGILFLYEKIKAFKTYKFAYSGKLAFSVEEIARARRAKLIKVLFGEIQDGKIIGVHAPELLDVVHGVPLQVNDGKKILATFRLIAPDTPAGGGKTWRTVQISYTDEVGSSKNVIYKFKYQTNRLNDENRGRDISSIAQVDSNGNILFEKLDRNGRPSMSTLPRKGVTSADLMEAVRSNIDPDLARKVPFNANDANYVDVTENTLSIPWTHVSNGVNSVCYRGRTIGSNVVDKFKCVMCKAVDGLSYEYVVEILEPNKGMSSSRLMKALVPKNSCPVAGTSVYLR